MTLKEVKALIAFAQKRGLKSIKVGDLEVTFSDVAYTPKRRSGVTAAKAEPKADEVTRPAPPPGPTLQDINNYIYGNTDEQH